MEQITVPASVERLEEVLRFIENSMCDTGMDGKQQNNIKIAVEEIFVNIASYAYPSGDGEVTVSASVSPDALSIEFRDSGTPYDPLTEADPDTSLPVDERKIGGLGIFIVKNIMDDVKYCYEDGQNIITLMKKIVPH